MPRPYNYRGVGCLLLLIGPALCAAKEAVYLKTGFALEAESHTQEDQTLIFHIGAGTLAFPITEIARIETIPDLLISRAATVPPRPEIPDEILQKAAYVEGLDEDFIRSVAKVESGLRQEAISPKGAIGLMQLMPATAAKLHVDASQMQENAHGGAKYLRELLIRYKGNSALALAAYNAGPEAVAKYGGIPPYPETQRYVLLVLREYERRLKTKSSSQRSSLSR